ncbi:MAG: hypothetical protein ACW98Y_08130 [Candidatus Thorarchaeota archaeon]|jgi:hypothetical protein
MSYKISRITVVFLLLVAVLAYPVSACTVFVMEKEERILVGLNEDWPYHNNFSIRICDSDSNEFAYVAFCATNIPEDDIRIGMNDQGLVIDSFTIPDTIMNETDKPLFPRHLYDMVLGDCTSVDEVISLFEDYTLWATYFRGYWDIQFFVADRDGNAVVISPGPDGRIAFTLKEGEYHAITNFNPVMPELGWYPCSRYSYAINKLHQMNSSEDLTIDDCRSILQNVGSDGRTSFSVIFDLSSADMWVFFDYNFDECATFNLFAEIERGEYSETIYTLEMMPFEEVIVPPPENLIDVGIIVVVGALTVLCGSIAIYILRRKKT